MNFKLTLWKSIVAVVGGLIAGYLAFALFGIGKLCEKGAPPSCFEGLIPLPLYVYILFFILLIYMTWSFLQKKKD